MGTLINCKMYIDKHIEIIMHNYANGNVAIKEDLIRIFFFFKFKEHTKNAVSPAHFKILQCYCHC